MEPSMNQDHETFNPSQNSTVKLVVPQPSTEGIMLGTVQSNEFKVRDVEAFFAWLEDKGYSWCTEDEDREVLASPKGIIEIQGKAWYPCAVPKLYDPIEEIWNPVDSEIFACEFQQHLVDDGVVLILAVGASGSSHTGYSELMISRETFHYGHVFTDDTDEEIKTRLQEVTRKAA